MDLGLRDRVFLVTAASSGLGRATAEQLVAEGARVVLVARREDVLADVVAGLGAGRAISLTADLADPSAGEHACRLALDTLRQARRGPGQCRRSGRRLGPGHPGQ